MRSTDLLDINAGNHGLPPKSICPERKANGNPSKPDAPGGIGMMFGSEKISSSAPKARSSTACTRSAKEILSRDVSSARRWRIAESFSRTGGPRRRRWLNMRILCFSATGRRPFGASPLLAKAAAAFFRFDNFSRIGQAPRAKRHNVWPPRASSGNCEAYTSSTVGLTLLQRYRPNFVSPRQFDGDENSSRTITIEVSRERFALPVVVTS